MKRPAAASIAVFVAVILVTAAIVVALALGTDGATAIEVGDTRISRETVNDELEAVADFRPGEWRTTPGAITAEVSTQLTTQMVWEQLTDRYLDRAGERVTAEDRATAREQTVGAGFRRLPEWFQDRLLDRQAKFAALTRLEGEAGDSSGELRVLRREARRAGVTVDRAYGRWAPVQAQVVQYPTPFTPEQG